MTVYFMKEIDKLKRNVLELSALVEENLNRSIRAIESADPALANEVIDHDNGIDMKEIEVEEECLKILALHQPVAVDLRYVISVIKINHDLERIGDLSVNIAERALMISSVPRVRTPIDFHAMARKVQFMVKRCLDALVNFDGKAANDVCALDDEIDDINKANYKIIMDAIALDNSTDNVQTMINYLMVSRQLERIADHAVNISEDLVYLIAGKVIRHNTENTLFSRS